MGQHLIVHLALIADPLSSLLIRCLRRCHIGRGQHLVDVVHQLREGFGLAVAGLRQLHAKIGADMSGIAAQHNDPIRQQHRLLNVVGHQEDGFRGHGLLGPKLQKFTAQILGGQHVEGRERLVHEEHLGLHHQRPRKPYALPHAARKLLGVGGLKAVQPNRVQHAHAAGASFIGRHSTGLQRRLHVLKNRQPREEREALKHNGHIDFGLRDRLFMPVHLPRRGPR